MLASLLRSTGPGVHLASVVTACGLSNWAAGLQSTGSVLVVLGFTCSVVSMPCGIFPDQGSTQGLQHGQSSSSLLSHWGSPSLVSIADRWSSLPGTAIFHGQEQSMQM